jgi:hypothetical protein
MGGEMELRHLRYFVAIAEARSMTVVAGRKLHTSQPPLSRQIRDLGEEVRAQLLTRRARGIELTHAGRIFLDHARLVLSQVDAAGETARRVANPSKPCFTIGCRRALRLASPSAGTEVMGFLHMFADARMPIWGVSAILSNFLLVVLSRSGQRWFYFASLLMLILFVVIYARLSKPINRLQTEAARTGESLNNGRELQASWDRSVMIRVPLLVVSLLAQCLVLLVASA